MRGDAAQRDGQKDDCGKPQTEDKSKQHIFTPRFILSNRAPPYFRAARFFSLTAPSAFFLIFGRFAFVKFNFERLPS